VDYVKLNFFFLSPSFPTAVGAHAAEPLLREMHSLLSSASFYDLVAEWGSSTEEGMSGIFF